MRDFGWVHTLTAARELRLKDGRLYQAPLFLDEQGEHSSTWEHLSIADLDVGEAGVEIEELRDQRSFVLRLVVGRSAPWELLLGKADGPHVTFTFDPDTFTVDRSTSLYPHGDRRTVPLPSRSEVGDNLEIVLVHDRSVTEVFIGGGHTAFTMRSYLDADSFQVLLRGDVSVKDASATLM